MQRAFYPLSLVAPFVNTEQSNKLAPRESLPAAQLQATASALFCPGLKRWRLQTHHCIPVCTAYKHWLSMHLYMEGFFFGVDKGGEYVMVSVFLNYPMKMTIKSIMKKHFVM